MHRLALALSLLAPLCAVAGPPDTPRPNILWITSEDNGPELGCYGDNYAVSPNIDRLAASGLRYNFCWSNAPVCAPARTTLISGLYPTSTGAENMRSLVALPDGMTMYPQLLRDAGYFTANATKEDFNLKTPGKLWDVNGDRRAWQKREDGQPFFCIVNITTSHESQLRKRPHTPVHDPAGVRVPAYHPDTPEVRRDWAQYYDKITEMDVEVGAVLDQLEQDGLAESTIVFYYGDHGSGMPRSKRSAQNSGLRVPLVVRIPEMFKGQRPADYRDGGSTDRLVAFVDFAPTLLSLTGIAIPKTYQGAAFLGAVAGEPNRYLHGFRGRMDERTDLVRSVTDGRFVYVKNYLPHRVHGQHVSYMFQTPTTQVWKALFDAGRLNDAQRIFWQPKAYEELFDLNADPDEVHNLADSAEHRADLLRLRAAQQDQVRRVRDIGLLSEAEMQARCREWDITPYALGHRPERYPLDRILITAEAAASRHETVTPALVASLDDADAGVRYWAVTGLLIRGEAGFNAAPDRLRAMLADPSASVRIAAAETLGRYGTNADAERAVALLLAEADYQTSSEYAATAALQVLDELLGVRPDAVASQRKAIATLPLPTSRTANPRATEYPSRLKTTLLDRLGEQ